MVDLDRKLKIETVKEECFVCESAPKKPEKMISASFSVKLPLLSVEKKVYLHRACADILVSALQEKISEI